MGARKEKICRTHNCGRKFFSKSSRILYCPICRKVRKNASAYNSTKRRRDEEKMNLIYNVFKKNDDLLDKLADKFIAKLTEKDWSIFLGKLDDKGRQGGVILFGKTGLKTKFDKWTDKLRDEQRTRDRLKEKYVKEENQGLVDSMKFPK